MKSLEQFYFLGLPLSPLYGLAMKIRSHLYSNDVFKVSKLSVPVISVGNLTMGGSGKTPTVQMLARFLQSKGLTPGVISRGYGGKARKDINVVSDGVRILVSVEEAGDEPFMLAESVPGLRVVTGKKRYLPARYAQDHLGCDVLILDDGFQHMAVYRDLDIVLFNATTLAGNNRVFPGGDLREPRSALHRADLFLLTGITRENAQNALRFQHELNGQFPNTPVFTAENAVEGIFDQEGARHDVNTMPLYALSGIANPKRFTQLLTTLGVQLTGHNILKDHTTYNLELIKKINESAIASGAAGIITTHKDLVKLEGFQFDLPLYCLRISAHAATGFFDYILTKMKLLDGK